MKLIGLTGKARAGKDTVAAFLESYAGYQRIGLADPLKGAVTSLFGLGPDWIMNDALKEVEHPYWKLSPRRIFQLLGTEAMRRTFGEDFWVHRAFLDIERLEAQGQDSFVISDVRFDNEARAIVDRGGIVIEVTRPQQGELDLGGDAARHESESGVHPGLIAFRVSNDRGVETLNHRVIDILKLAKEGGFDV